MNRLDENKPIYWINTRTTRNMNMARAKKVVTPVEVTTQSDEANMGVGVGVGEASVGVGTEFTDGLDTPEINVPEMPETATAETAEEIHIQYSDELQRLPTKSAKIRYLSAQGMSRGDISRHLGISYQHVRNVLITPLKS